MHYLDRWLVQWITRLIFLHLLLSAAAMMGVIFVVLNTWEFFDNSIEAMELSESGTPIELPLVRHPDERYFTKQGYRFFYDETEYSVQYGHRDEPSQDLEFLTVYEEPLREDVLGKVIEVPSNPSMQTVYEQMQGQTWFSGLRVVICVILGWLFVVYLAVRGFFLMKGKNIPGGRQRQSRR